MKTPRELILEKHQAADAKLRAIRAEELAAFVKAPARGHSCPQQRGTEGELPQFSTLWRVRELLRTGMSARRFWEEAVWPLRRVWLGMASLWLVILAFNLAAREPHRIAIASMPPPPPEVMTALREQKQLMVQMLETSNPPTLLRPKTPGPRSERRQTLVLT